MTSQTITRITLLISLTVSLFSSVVALLTGGDLFFVFVYRFVIVFVVSMVIAWVALTIISSVIISAARSAMQNMQRELTTNPVNQSDVGMETVPETDKGRLLDLTSTPPDESDLYFDPSDEKKPEVLEFEPFKPQRLDADIADSR